MTTPAHSEAGTPCDMVVDADLGTAQTAEIFFSLIRAGTIEAVRLLVVDALHFKPLMKAIPRTGFVGIDDGALGNSGLDE